MKKLRLILAKWLWPKEVKAGELFTIVNHLNAEGAPTRDGSWVGDTLRAEIVDGDRIAFSKHNEYGPVPRFDPVKGFWLLPGKNCTLKLLAVPATREEARVMYAQVKGHA